MASAPFQQALRARRRFVLPATALFLAWYLGFVVLAGYAPGVLGSRVLWGLNLWFLLGFSQFVMSWLVCRLYVAYADRVLDPLRERAVSLARPDAAGATPWQEPTLTRPATTTVEGAR
jgi:uncharacterized membrane protein (DUF485 family)